MVVPRHGNEEIERGLLRKIALDLRISAKSSPGLSTMLEPNITGTPAALRMIARLI
jgi:hypothetical protein